MTVREIIERIDINNIVSIRVNNYEYVSRVYQLPREYRVMEDEVDVVYSVSIGDESCIMIVVKG